jgi:hypothetical protein
MHNLTDIEIFNIVSTILSILLSFFAIAFGLWVYTISNKIDKQTALSLTKIETQARSLQEINAKWMDRLIRFVTSNRPNPLDTIGDSLVKFLADIPKTLVDISNQKQQKEVISDRLSLTRDQMNTFAISLFFYTAQTNYWSQFYFPSESENRPEDPIQMLLKRIIDLSYDDFKVVETVLSKTSQDELKKNRHYDIYDGTRLLISPHLKNIKMILEERARNGESSPLV